MKKKILFVGLLTMLELGATYTVFAQNNPHQNKTITKEINVDEDSGEKTVTITTTEDGKTTIETFTGNDAEKFIEEHHKNLQHNKGTHQMIFISDGEEQHVIELDFDKLLEQAGIEIEGNDGKEKMTVKSYAFDYSYDDADHNIHITEKEIDQMVEEIMNKHHITNEEHGNMIIIKEEEHCSSEKEAEELLKKMDVQTDEKIQKGDKVIVKKVIVVDGQESKSNESYLEDEDSHLNIYPNPSTGKFTLTFGVGNKKRIDINITDINGKTVYSRSVKGDMNYSLPIDLSGESKGVYMLSVTQNKTLLSEKFFIE